MRLRFTPRAARDLIEIADYIRADNPGAATRVRGAILATLDILARFPRVGRQQSAEGVRKVVTRRYGYVIYYMTDDVAGDIVILTIQHPARSPGQDD